MTHFKQQSFAAVLAVCATVLSLQAIVSVPPAQAMTETTVQMVELA